MDTDVQLQTITSSHGLWCSACIWATGTVQWMTAGYILKNPGKCSGGVHHM